MVAKVVQGWIRIDKEVSGTEQTAQKQTQVAACCVCDKGSLPDHVEKMGTSLNSAWTTTIHSGKKQKTDPYLTTSTKISFRLIRYNKIARKGETIKDTGEYPHEPGTGKNFLNKI